MSEKKYTFEKFPTPKDVKVGQAVFDILNKEQSSQEVGETLEMMMPKYLEELRGTCFNGSKMYKSPFYVVVLGKKEAWALNVLRHFFIARQTKPDSRVLLKDYPNYFQDVFEYSETSGNCRLLWSLTAHWNHQEILQKPDLYHPDLVQWHVDHYAGKLRDTTDAA
jgi:hypothetical protein